MGEVIAFWDYKRETLPNPPFAPVKIGPCIDLRDKPSARIYVMPSTHVVGRIYPDSRKLLPPVFLNEKPKS